MKKNRRFVLVNIIVLIFIICNFSSTVNIAAEVAIPEEAANESLEATGFFYVDKDENGVWWFINQTGHKFYSFSVGGAIPGPFFYDDVSNWRNMTKKRLVEWGFNTLGREFNSPYYIKVSQKFLVGRHGWTHTRIPDVFDLEWKENVSKRIGGMADLYRNDSNLLGYQTDNEMKWGPDTQDDLTLLEVYMAAPAETPGKQELVRFLRDDRYGNNTVDFNQVWNMDIDSFNDLLDLENFGIKDAWRFRSDIKYYRDKLKYEYPHLKNNEIFKKAVEDIKLFSTNVAETYFNTTSSVLDATDPNHLYLGVRFHLFGVPEEVLRVCGRYVDVISINYYRNNILVYDPLSYIISRQYGCVPLDNWMSRYHELTGKPLFVGEYNSIGNDGSWPIEPGLESKVLSTQKDRANYYEWYTRHCLKNPYMVGQNWFFYRDGFNRNYGLVDHWDNPYKPLINRTAKINSMAYEIHENASYDKTGINKLPSTSLLFDKKSLLSVFHEGISDTTLSDESERSRSNEYNVFDSKLGITEHTRYRIDNVDNGKTHYVGGSGPDNYSYIQDAINNSSDGDTIYVFTGNYSEIITIDKSITLKGDNKERPVISRVYESFDNIVIKIEADYVNITRFNITSEGRSTDSSGGIHACAGIYLKNYNNCNISNNIFYKLGDWGLMLLNGDNNVICNNVFFDQEGCGIIMDSSNNTLLQGNLFLDNFMYGIWMSVCKNNTIKHNTISNNIFGIIIVKANGNNILENSIQKNKQKGICLRSSDNNNITHNNFITDDERISVDFFIEFFLKKHIYLSAAFFYSMGNNWNENYWNRARLLPKPIYGVKEGVNGLVLCINFDWHPLKEPYEP